MQVAHSAYLQPTWIQTMKTALVQLATISTTSFWVLITNWLLV